MNSSYSKYQSLTKQLSVPRLSLSRKSSVKSINNTLQTPESTVKEQFVQNFNDTQSVNSLNVTKVSQPKLFTLRQNSSNIQKENQISYPPQQGNYNNCPRPQNQNYQVTYEKYKSNFSQLMPIHQYFQKMSVQEKNFEETFASKLKSTNYKDYYQYLQELVKGINKANIPYSENPTRTQLQEITNISERFSYQDNGRNFTKKQGKQMEEDKGKKQVLLDFCDEMDDLINTYKD